MNKQLKPLTQLTINEIGKIYDINGGYGVQRKLNTMGIIKDQGIKIISKQPFRGPITIKVCGCMMTIGQGLAKKIIVEVI
jgi:Fe2+ transport system protein FeoA